MTDTFATQNELEARVSSAYTVPADASQLLAKASELIDHVTDGRAQIVFDGTDADLKTLLSNATCDQVEYWLEVGEEFDVTNLQGALIGGRVQVQNLPRRVGARAMRTLLRAGLYYGGVGAMG